MKKRLRPLLIPLLAGFILAALMYTLNRFQNANTVTKYNGKLIITSTSNGEMQLSDLKSFFQKRLESTFLEYHLNMIDSNKAEIHIRDVADTTSVRDLLIHLPKVSIHEIYPFEVMEPAVMYMLSRLNGRNEPGLEDTISATDTTETAGLAESIETEMLKENSTRSGFIPAPAGDNDKGVIHPMTGYINCSDTGLFRERLSGDEIIKRSPQGARMVFGRIWNSNTCAQPHSLEVYFVRHNEMIDIRTSDFHQAVILPNENNSADVSIQFTEEGAVKWEAITRANKGRPVGILVDDQVVSAPVVNETITNGSALISGLNDRNVVEELAGIFDISHRPATLAIASSHFTPQSKRGGLNRAVAVILAFIAGFLTTYYIRKALIVR